MKKGNDSTAKMVLKYAKENTKPEFKDKVSFKVTYLNYENDTADYLIDVQVKVEEEKIREFRATLSSFDPAIKDSYSEIDEVISELNQKIERIIEDLNKPEEPEIDKSAYIKEVTFDIHTKLEEALSSLDGTIGYFKGSNSSGIQVLIDEVYPLIKQINDNIETINKTNALTSDALMNM